MYAKDLSFGDLHRDSMGLAKSYGMFSGTSSAAPTVASVIIAIQSWYKRQTNTVLTPYQMRKLIIETGAPQNLSISGHIGPLPNIRNAIDKLQQLQ